MIPAGLLAGDLLRLAGVASMVVALVAFDGIAVALFALVLLGLLVPRLLALPAALDVGCGLTVLVAAWSAVLGVYEAVPWWDLVVHAACTGVLALVAAIALDRAAPSRAARGIRRPPAGAAAWTACLGLGLGVLWEIGEWAGNTYLDPQIHVGYPDTLTDLVAGVAGSAVAGALAARAVPEPEPLSGPESRRSGAHFPPPTGRVRYGEIDSSRESPQTPT